MPAVHVTAAESNLTNYDLLLMYSSKSQLPQTDRNAHRVLYKAGRRVPVGLKQATDFYLLKTLGDGGRGVQSLGQSFLAGSTIVSSQITV